MADSYLSIDSSGYPTYLRQVSKMIHMCVDLYAIRYIEKIDR